MLYFDPVRFAIAVVPLAAYLGLLGLINLRPRPSVVSGASDLAALGIGVMGLVFIGPIELLRPTAGTAQFLNYIWLVLLALYLLVIILAALVARPRLVVYNLTPEELRPLLSEAAGRADATCRWAGDSLVLPKLGVQLHMDGFGLLRNTSLVSSGPNQNLEGWQRLAKQLRGSLRTVKVRPHPSSLIFLAIAVLLLVASEFYLLASPDEVAEAMSELFSFGWSKT